MNGVGFPYNLRRAPHLLVDATIPSVMQKRSLMPERIQVWLEPFALDAFLLPHVQTVMLALPDPVRDELMGDPAFGICDFEPGPATVAHIPISLPGRCVVLKRNLRGRSAAFILYVIAHELAHAHLRNRGRGSGEDPEIAADSLAAAWGFPRPAAGQS